MKTFKTYHYDSLYEFIDQANKTPKHKRESCDVSGIKRNEWSQSKSIKDALNIVRNGHELEKIDSKLDQIKTKEKHELEMSYNIAGMLPDVPEFLTGNPACMVNFEKMPTDVNYINLILQIDEASIIKADQFFNRAIAISSIINDLEVNGYRVKLSLCFVVKFSKGTIGTIIDLKDYDQSLGLSEITGVLHPSFLRRIIFLWIEGRSWLNKNTDIDQGMGKVQPFAVIDKFVSDQSTEKYLLIPSVTTLIMNKKALYNNCYKFKNVEGAKIFANHITNQIEGM